MGCRILEGHEEGSDLPNAVFFCSTTGVAFGPLMVDAEDAHCFRRYLTTVPVVVKFGTPVANSDPRMYADTVLRDHYADYRAAHTTCAIDGCETWQGEAFAPDGQAACAACAGRLEDDDQPIVPRLPRPPRPSAQPPWGPIGRLARGVEHDDGDPRESGTFEEQLRRDNPVKP